MTDNKAFNLLEEIYRKYGDFMIKNMQRPKWLILSRHNYHLLMEHYQSQDLYNFDTYNGMVILLKANNHEKDTNLVEVA